MNYTFSTNNRDQTATPKLGTSARKAISTCNAEYVTDVSRQTRQQIISLAEFVKANIPDMSAIETRLVRNTVGTGLKPSFKTGDDKFDAEVNEYLSLYTGEASRVDVSGRNDFYSFQKKISKEILTPGECFILLTKEGEGTFKTRKLQWIDPNRVYGDFKDVEYLGEKADVIDGVVRNKLGKSIAYLIWPSFLDTDVSKNKNWKSYAVSSRNLIHVVDYTIRPDLMRGIPKCTAGLTHAQDMGEITQAYIAKLKALAKHVLAFKKAPGSKDPWSEDKSRNTLNRKAQKARGLTEAEITERDMLKAAGTAFPNGAILSVNKEDDFDLLESKTPSSEVAAFIKQLSFGLVRSYGVHPEAILDPSGLKGTGVRYILTDTEKAIEELQLIIEKQFSKRVIIWLIAGQIADGRITNPPKNWWKSLCFTKPSRLTVDYSRDAKIDLDLIDAGMMTEEQYCDARGTNWESNILQRIKEIKFAMSEAKSAGVPFELLRKNRPGSTNNQIDLTKKTNSTKKNNE